MPAGLPVAGHFAHATLLLSHCLPAIVTGSCWTVMRGRAGPSCSATRRVLLSAILVSRGRRGQHATWT
eukprot:725768-Alexandrium_andersonii.AAC.1